VTRVDLPFSEPPVCVKYPEDWRFPAFFSSGHSGANYPPTFLAQSSLTPLELRKSEDFMVDSLFDGCLDIGAPMVRALFPRAYCDPNRDPYELDPSMFSDPLPKYAKSTTARVCAGIGSIPKMVSADLHIYSGQLPFSEAKTRLDQCYFPYHTSLKRLISQCKDMFGEVLLIDCHSMPDSISNTPSKGRLADFVLGTRFGGSCKAQYSTFIAAILEDAGYSVSFNQPYAGGFITQSYADKARSIHCLQIEINRNLYMDPVSMSPTENMPQLKADLTHMMSELAQYMRAQHNLRDIAQ
jgi:N-formylglutamate amidohydrolase